MSSNDAERPSIREDEQFHDYHSHTIPWFVRIMWLFFWIFAIVYTIRFMFPAFRIEFFGE